MHFPILLSALAAIILPISAQICLTEFQPISNFPQACTDAYSQTINGCSAAQDFSSPNTCTPGCIAALDAVQTEIQTACSGQQVTKASVIGQFFLGNGPDFVCSGLKISQSGAGQSVTTTTTSQAATTTHDESTTTTVPVLPTSATATTTKTSTRTNGSPVIVITTLKKSTQLPTMPTMTPAATASSTETTKPEHTQSKTLATSRSSSSSIAKSQSDQTTKSSTSMTSSTSTTTASQSEQTTSSSGGGGGGSPFDPNANRGAKLMGNSWLFGVMVCFWIAGSIR